MQRVYVRMVRMRIPRETAIAGGCAEYGSKEYVLTHWQLKELSDPELQWLSTHPATQDGGACIVLHGTRYDWPTVRDSIRAALSDEQLREAQKRQCILSCARFASSIPALARAAREGYDVRPDVLDHVARELTRIDDGALVLVERSPEHKDLEITERSAPHRSGFRVLDRVRDWAATVARPDCLAIEIGRISACQRSGLRFTAVPVRLTMGLGAGRVILFPADDEVD